MRYLGFMVIIGMIGMNAFRDNDTLLLISAIVALIPLLVSIFNLIYKAILKIKKESA
jgi:uncharacterized membrane protein